MKAFVIKPVLWNDNGYIYPAGAHHATRSWPAKLGYGHEEWNNNPKRIWQDCYRIFHTEPNQSHHLDEYAKNGNLGMLMITSNQGKQYAVGIAVNVFVNSIDNREAIARDLNLYDDWKQAWVISSAIGKYKFGSEKEFIKKHWGKSGGYTWFLWRCPDRLYHWFKKPILIRPSDLGLKTTRFVQEYSSWQRIYPDRVAEWLKYHVPNKNKSIIAWLEEGPFDESMLPTGDRSAKQLLPRRKESKSKQKSSGQNAPPSYAYSYWVKGERTAHPKHAELQSSFVEFLRKQPRSKSITQIEENIDYIDVCYIDSGKVVITEVKPAQEVGTKYAIRAAIGQLLEYRFFKKPNAHIEIVLNKKPTSEEITFVKELDIRLAYRTGKKWSHIKS